MLWYDSLFPLHRLDFVNRAQEFLRGFRLQEAAEARGWLFLYTKHYGTSMRQPYQEEA